MPSTSNEPRSRARIWLKRILLGILVTANIGVFYVYWQLRSIDEVVHQTAQTVADVVPQLTPTLPGDSAPITFLIVGSDSRENLADTTDFGIAAGERSDVIMLVKVYPEDDRAQILSLPRDLWVDIPGNGQGKINSAYALGGAPLVIETVTAFTDIDINHYVEIDFLGFQSIVDQLGGISVDFLYPARDSKSGLDVGAGLQTLSGDQALAFARSRRYQELRDGSWVSVDADDFGRTARQQQLLVSILDQIKRPSSITEAAAIVGSFTEHVAMDEALADSSMIEFAFRMRGLRGGNIETITLPGVIDTVGAQSVVLAKEPGANSVIEAFRSGTSMIVAAGDQQPLQVVVLNGNGLSGSAGEWSVRLGSAGFLISGVADAERSDYDETLVKVRFGDEADGDSIVSALGFGRVEAGVVPGGTDAVVVLGADAVITAG